MDIFRYSDVARPPRLPQPVLALGNFDGLHRGHLKVVDRVRRRASERKGTAVLMTFDPHPTKIVRPDKAPPLLMTLPQKIEAVRAAGLDAMAIVHFTREMSLWDPETFVRRVLAEWLAIIEVWVGANFLFGHDRTGNFSLLRSLGPGFGYRAEQVEPVRYKEFVVSSTRIRRLIAEGRVDEAAALLGHLYTIDGEVVKGDERGRQLGFPTANIRTENELLPVRGVYATGAYVRGTLRPGVTNIGVRPTFGGDRGVIETHIFDVDEDLYGQPVRLAFFSRLRDEQRFAGPDALVDQVRRDCARARALFDRLSL